MGTTYIDPREAAECDDAADIAAGRETVDDVQQQVYDGPAIPVRVVDPVAAQELPSRGTAPNNVAVDQTTPGKLCGQDPRRSLLVISTDADCFIGIDYTETMGKKRAFRLPADTTLTLHSPEAWYVIGDVGAANVSIITEQWAR